MSIYFQVKMKIQTRNHSVHNPVIVHDRDYIQHEFREDISWVKNSGIMKEGIER